MARSRLTSIGVAIVALAVLAAVALGAGGLGSGPKDPGGKPTPTPPTKPSAPPSGSPSNPIGIVDLDTADGHDVSVEIDDRVGLVKGAATGRPGDGMSVEPGTLEVQNVDATTLRLTWVDFPIDNHLTLFVFADGAGLRLVLAQPEPTEPTDSIGFDRVLLIEFDEPVSADDVVATIQDGVDTPG